MKTSILAKSMIAIGIIGLGSILMSGGSSLNHMAAGFLIVVGLTNAAEHVGDDAPINAMGVRRAGYNLIGAALFYGLLAGFLYAIGQIPREALDAVVLVGSAAPNMWFVPGSGLAILYMIATQSLFDTLQDSAEERQARRQVAKAEAMARPVTSAAGVAVKGAALAAIFAMTLNLTAITAALGLPAGTMGNGGSIHMVAWPIAAIIAYAILSARLNAPLLDPNAALARVDARFGTDLSGSHMAPVIVAGVSVMTLSLLAAIFGLAPANPSAAEVAHRIHVVWALGVVTMAALFGAEASEPSPKRVQAAA